MSTRELFGRPVEVEPFVIVPSILHRGRWAILANRQKDEDTIYKIEEKKLEIRSDRKDGTCHKMTYTTEEVSRFLDWFGTQVQR